MTIPASDVLRGVLFDLDGVLIDSSRAWHRVINRGRERLGYAPPISWQAFIATFGQSVERDRDDFFARHSVEQVDALFDELMCDELDAIALDPLAHTVLDALAERGLARAVVTNTPLALARRVLAATDIAPRVQALCAAGEAASKPAPDLVLLCLERLGLSASEVVYVGDSASDRGATRAAGVAMLGLRTDGDARIESLQDLLELVKSA
ncbi:MAG: HAD family hydrolase [Myxococcales bacterium]|nr:HAD family hydrolase [Myxococcales bacterium]